MFQSPHLLQVLTCICAFFNCSCLSEHCTVSVNEKILIVKDDGMADVNITARGEKCVNSSITVWDSTGSKPVGVCYVKSGANGSFSCVATINTFNKLGPKRLRLAGKLSADVWENITVFGIIKELTVYSEGEQQNEKINCTQIQTPSNGMDNEENINSNSSRISNITTAAQAENDTCQTRLTLTKVILYKDRSNDKTNKTVEVRLGTNLTFVCSWTGNASALITRNGQRLQSTMADNTSIFNIPQVRCTDGGVFICGSDLVTENRSVHLVIQSQCPDGADNLLIIIISGSAGLFFILLVVTIVCCCIRKRNAPESMGRPEQIHAAGPEKLQVWKSDRLSDVYDQALPLAEEGDKASVQQDQLWRPLPRVPSGKDEQFARKLHPLEKSGLA